MKDVSEQQLAKAVGAAISKVRAQCGMTQDQAAEALEIGPEAISRMERGVVVPSLARLVEFAELFKCPVETFFNKATGLTDDNAEKGQEMTNIHSVSFEENTIDIAPQEVP